MLICLYNLIRKICFNLFYCWRGFEKLTSEIYSSIMYFFYKISSTYVLPSISLSPSADDILFFCKKQLMFEYCNYTPFLKTPRQAAKAIKTSRKLTITRRVWLIKYLQSSQPVLIFQKIKTPAQYHNNNTSGQFFNWFRIPLLLLKNNTKSFTSSLTNFFTFTVFFKSLFHQIFLLFRKTLGSGFFYLKGMSIVFFLDACLTDDEPLWEPIEWSLVQSWILFIFLFAWIGENLITSAFGSYTGRDKRVWFGWYKSFWLIELWYALSLGAAALFVITPFYNELTYTTPFIVSWWTWYSRVFFCKFVTMYSLVLYISYFLQINIRFLNWKKLLLCTIVINLFLSYLLYIHFFMSFFGYLTNPNWYLNNRLVDYIQLSHEPHRWGWGVTKPGKRDHFLQHRSTSIIWFKNDGPYASAFLFFHVFFFLCLFTLYLFWLTLMRRAYATQEFTYTFTTFCISSLRQFFFFFFLLYLLVFFSFIINYWRTPVENHWLFFNDSLIWHLYEIYRDLFKVSLSWIF